MSRRADKLVTSGTSNCRHEATDGAHDIHRGCGIVVASWGWGRSPYWWDYPNSWPPHICRDWGQLWWDLWWNYLLRMLHDWHYTQGWGSLGTITVAVLAIISSALYNRRTLRQARAIADDTLALATQQRADTRGDVLRTELARWLTVVSEIERTFAELFRRTSETNLQTDENDNPPSSQTRARRTGCTISVSIPS